MKYVWVANGYKGTQGRTARRLIFSDETSFNRGQPENLLFPSLSFDTQKTWNYIHIS